MQLSETFIHIKARQDTLQILLHSFYRVRSLVLPVEPLTFLWMSSHDCLMPHSPLPEYDLSSQPLLVINITDHFKSASCKCEGSKYIFPTFFKPNSTAMINPSFKTGYIVTKAKEYLCHLQANINLQGKTTERTWSSSKTLRSYSTLSLVYLHRIGLQTLRIRADQFPL